ncbi:YybH family protein [Mucilaginibacter calamicampi]|uniref:YybH family protein n=1 Tax=Mucilaginibacter calamicampi TaxID=1302352 RepID=A0ABW2YQG3_9SPHI
MKKLLLICVFTLTAHTMFAQDSKNIIAVMNKQMAAWNSGDLEGFMQGYWKSDSLLFVSSKPTHGWQATLNNYKRGYPDKAAMGKLSFDIIKVDVLDDKNAFVYGAWHLKREKDNPGGYFTLLFKKIKGEWKVVVDHTS